MKQFKMIIPLMALMLGLVGAFAFTPAPQTKPTADEAWFAILDPDGDTDDPSNYQKLSSEPTCATGARLCAVKAMVDENDPQYPDQEDINDLSENAKKHKN